MAHLLNRALDDLESSPLEVSTAAGQVASASDQITAGAQSLAHAAEEQASSIEGVAANLYEGALPSDEAIYQSF